MSTEQFVGKWELCASENFDEYLKHVGIGFMQRKIAASVKPTNDIQIDANGKWTIVLGTSFRSFTTEFQLNVEFEEETTDGRKVNTICTLTDEGKLIQIQRAKKEGEKDSKIERYVENGRLIMIMECEGVEAKRIYKKSA